MPNILDTITQYGIAGLALYMMYSITFNHLTKIYDILVKIESNQSKDS